jgi:hypothetical protein
VFASDTRTSELTIKLRLKKGAYERPFIVVDAQVWGTTTGMVFHVRAFDITHRNLVSKQDGKGHYLMAQDPTWGWLRINFDPNHVLSGNPPA